MNSMRRLFTLLTVLAMVTVAFSGIGCDVGVGSNGVTDGTTDYNSDSGQSEAGSFTSDGAAGGVEVPLPAGSSTTDDMGDTESE